MAHEAVAIAVEQRESNAPIDPQKDPMTIRWGLQCIERDRHVEGFRFGFSHVKYAEWQELTRFDVPEEFHTIDDSPHVPRETFKLHSAAEVANNLTELLGNTDRYGNITAGKKTKGYVVSFIGEEDAAKMAVVSKTLLPSLSKIRSIAAEMDEPSPISAVCEGQDDTDLEPRESCPTCWLKWITSDLCSTYIAGVAQEGMEVFNSLEPDKSWTVKPSAELLGQARQLTIESLRTGLRYIDAEWSQVLKELDENKRNGLDEFGIQNGMRKDCHKIKPADRQTNLVTEAAKAVSGNSGSNNAGLEAVLQQNAQILAMFAKALEGGQLTVNAPVVTSAPVESAPPIEPKAREYGEFGQCQINTASGTQCAHEATANGACILPAHQAKMAQLKTA